MRRPPMILLLVLLASCLVPAPPATAAAGASAAGDAPRRDGDSPPVEIRIVETDDDPYGWRYEPAEVTVEVGTTVLWHNAGTMTHTVTSEDGSFASPNLRPGATWKWRFEAPGDQDYYCSPHPWMRGRVRVVPDSS